MRDVDAARERVDVGVLMPFRLVQRLAARQHEIGALHQLGLTFLISGWRAFEADSSSMQS